MKVRNPILLVITALVWGVAFVAQQQGGEMLGPYSFNGIRSLLGGLVLLPVLAVMRRKGEKETSNRRELLTGGCLCGFFLFAGSTVQQLGLYYGAGVGKAGFLTAFYIILVPILGIFIKRKCGFHIWGAVLLALVGFYFLCVNGDFVLKGADLLLLACALLFAIHILVIDYFSPRVNGVAMSCIQFFVCGILSIVPMMTENGDGLRLLIVSRGAWIPVLYGGIMSCGVAYTLHIVGQKGVNPTVASLLLSLESVFSVLAGWILLGEELTGRELLGCGLIFIAIILAQLPIKTDKNTFEKGLE